MTVQRYLVQANSNDENFDADCHFAVVTLTPDLLKLLFKLQRLWTATQKQAKNLSLLEVVDSSVDFIRVGVAEELLGEQAFEAMEHNRGKPFLIPPRPEYKFEAEAIADYLTVTGRGFWWKAYPKHTDVSVESDQIDWAWFTQCAYCGHLKEVHVQGKCLFSPTNYKAYNAKT